MDKSKYNSFVAQYMDGIPNLRIRENLSISIQQFNAFLHTLLFKQDLVRMQNRVYYRLNSYCDQIEKERVERW